MKYFSENSMEMTKSETNTTLCGKKTCGFEVQPEFAVFVSVFTAPSGGGHAQLNTTHSPQCYFCLPGLSVECKDISVTYRSIKTQ